MTRFWIELAIAAFFFALAIGSRLRDINFHEELLNEHFRRLQ
jgi:hypothetical protein